MEFDQTFTTKGLCGKDEHIKFWGQKIKGQGHAGVKYGPKCTFWPCSCHTSGRRRRHNSRWCNHHLLLLLSLLLRCMIVMFL